MQIFLVTIVPSCVSVGHGDGQFTNCGLNKAGGRMAMTAARADCVGLRRRPKRKFYPPRRTGDLDLASGPVVATFECQGYGSSKRVISAIIDIT